MTAPLALLMDTNVVFEMMRWQLEPQIAAFPDSIAYEGLALPSVTAWEILNGIGRLDPGRRAMTSQTGSWIFSTNCSKIGSSIGHWPVHRRAPQ